MSDNSIVFFTDENGWGRYGYITSRDEAAGTVRICTSPGTYFTANTSSVKTV